MITYFPIFFTVLAAFHEDENLKFFILIDLIINEENHIFKVNDLKDKKIKKFIQN